MASNDNDWTFVSNRKNKVGKLSNKALQAITEQHQNEDKPSPIDSSITMEQLRADYDKQVRLWRNSGARKGVLKIFDFLKPDEGWGIKKAICLGTGSFNRLNHASLRSKRLTQLAVFIDLASVVYSPSTTEGSDDGHGKIQLFAQEPAYTDLDKEFMQELGFELVEFDHTQELGPAAELFGRDAFVCEFFIFYWGLTAKPFVQGGCPLMISTVRRHLMDETFFKLNYGHQIEGLLEELDARYRNYTFPQWSPDGFYEWEGLDIFGPQP